MNAITEESEPARVAPATSPEIDERYGRTPQNRRRTRLFGWTAAGGFAVVLVAWLIWGGVFEGVDKVVAVDIGHTILSESEIEVTFQITEDPGAQVNCAIEAQNELYSIVGWKIVELPASEQRTRQFTEIVRTTETSATGLIHRCWLS
ncbi:MAG: DUF4307 domain-containing protein [Glaciihabitans sp.]